MKIKELINELEKYDNRELIVYREYEGCYRDINKDEFEVTDKGLLIAIDE